MNFNDWLDGFLEGKESLNKDEIELIKQKMATTYPVYIPYIQEKILWHNPWYSTDGTTADNYTISGGTA